jgi:AGZA family xanthine/uracil permease-like MFS transporter
VVVGILFLIAIFLSPLAGIVPAQATAPTLILVGFLMSGLIKGIDFDDFEEGFPALLAIVLMPLTFSITVGIGAGFVMYTLIKVVKGKFGDVHPLMWVVTISFLVYFGQAVLGAAIAA